MDDRANLTRRAVITGQALPSSGAGLHHISSAVVTVLPSRRDDVAARLAAIQGVEVHAAEVSKIVIVIEGPSTGFLGERLTKITLLDGVIAANMVCELTDTVEDRQA
jgi:nitrate reductase NapD